MTTQVDPQKKMKKLNNWYLIQFTQFCEDYADNGNEIIIIRGKNKALNKAKKWFREQTKIAKEQKIEDEEQYLKAQVYRISDGFKIDFENNSNRKPIFSRVQGE